MTEQEIKDAIRTSYMSFIKRLSPFQGEIYFYVMERCPEVLVFYGKFIISIVVGN